MVIVIVVLCIVIIVIVVVFIEIYQVAVIMVVAQVVVVATTVKQGDHARFPMVASEHRLKKRKKRKNTYTLWWSRPNNQSTGSEKLIFVTDICAFNRVKKMKGVCKNFKM